MFNDPVVVVAAGHAASYVMQLAHRKPAPWSWAVLVSPTWRGPLPTAMGEHRRVYRGLQMLINMPILGQFLYGLNTTKSFLKLMLKRHVFAHPSMVSRDLVRQKQRITRKRRSRLASSAFVTGGLDVIKTSEAWLHWFQPLPLPAMMVIGDQTPPKSRQEMEVVAHFSAVQVHRMSGSLGLHEEYPEALAQVMLPFLEKYLSSKRG
jgi:pimeloyl-ACP methyl ester carboxylesterase